MDVSIPSLCPPLILPLQSTQSLVQWSTAMFQPNVKILTRHLIPVTCRPIRSMLWPCGPPGLLRWMDRLQSLSRWVEGEENDSVCKADVKRDAEV